MRNLLAIRAANLTGTYLGHPLCMKATGIAVAR